MLLLCRRIEHVRGVLVMIKSMLCVFQLKMNRIKRNGNVRNMCFRGIDFLELLYFYRFGAIIIVRST